MVEHRWEFAPDDLHRSYLLEYSPDDRTRVLLFIVEESVKAKKRAYAALNVLKLYAGQSTPPSSPNRECSSKPQFPPLSLEEVA
mmetsp:Transcript_108569/g.248818  ORF Transcript_108569/g.248818 Transcript_108569/m.248818 type:complete len:84 (-) Transcript_108569:204-455(-)